MRSNPVLIGKVYDYRDYKIVVNVSGQRTFQVLNNKDKIIKDSKDTYCHTHKALEHAKHYVDGLHL